MSASMSQIYALANSIARQSEAVMNARTLNEMHAAVCLLADNADTLKVWTAPPLDAETFKAIQNRDPDGFEREEPPSQEVYKAFERWVIRCYGIETLRKYRMGE